MPTLSTVSIWYRIFSVVWARGREMCAALAKSLEVKVPSSSKGTNCRKSWGQVISISRTSSVGMRS